MQIRAEAGPLYYRNSRFTADTTDWNSDSLLIFTAKNRRVRAEFEIAVWEMQLVIDGPRRPNWQNLIVWLQRYYDTSARARLGVGDIQQPTFARVTEAPLIVAMFSTVRALRDKPWNEVKLVLLDHREALKAIDPAWGA